MPGVERVALELAEKVVVVMLEAAQLEEVAEERLHLN